MKNKSLVRGIVFLLFVGLLFPVSRVLAGSEYLVRYSSKTYVKNEHDGGWSDTYYGHLGIKGAERYGEMGEKYPSFSRITYVLNGENHRYYLYSKGETDTVARTKTVTFKDNWDFGPVTRAYGLVALSHAKSTLMSIDSDAIHAQ